MYENAKKLQDLLYNAQQQRNIITVTVMADEMNLAIGKHLAEVLQRLQLTPAQVAHASTEVYGDYNNIDQQTIVNIISGREEGLTLYDLVKLGSLLKESFIATISSEEYAQAVADSAPEPTPRADKNPTPTNVFDMLFGGAEKAFTPGNAERTAMFSPEISTDRLIAKIMGNIKDGISARKRGENSGPLSSLLKDFQDITDNCQCANCTARRRREAVEKERAAEAGQPVPASPNEPVTTSQPEMAFSMHQGEMPAESTTQYKNYQQWLRSDRAKGAKYIIDGQDNFDYSHYPVYVMDDDIETAIAKFDNKPNQDPAIRDSITAILKL